MKFASCTASINSPSERSFRRFDSIHARDCYKCGLFDGSIVPWAQEMGDLAVLLNTADNDTAKHSNVRDKKIEMEYRKAGKQYHLHFSRMHGELTSVK